MRYTLTSSPTPKPYNYTYTYTYIPHSLAYFNDMEVKVGVPGWNFQVNLSRVPEVPKKILGAIGLNRPTSAEAYFFCHFTFIKWDFQLNLEACSGTLGGQKLVSAPSANQILCIFWNFGVKTIFDPLDPWRMGMFLRWIFCQFFI